MPDFGFARLDLNLITKRIELPEASPDPSRPITLIVRCAMNRDFAATVFKQQKSAEPPADAPAETTAIVAAPPAESEAVQRAQLAAAYATAIVDWENVTEGGSPVAYSPELGAQLLDQLIEHAPDIWRVRVLNFITNDANFRTIVRMVDPVDLGKEPPRG